MDLAQIKTPTLIIDPIKCYDNIHFMVKKAQKHNLIFRPHFKTHQSQTVGLWFKKQGVEQITVSSVQMAKYFSGIYKDITIAFPVNVREICDINTLAQNTQLNIVIENLESIHFLDKSLKHNTSYYIKIDTGYNRTGVNSESLDIINDILDEAGKNMNLQFKGFLCHAGNTYATKDIDEIHTIHNKNLKSLSALRNNYQNKYPNLIISIGDTPSCSLSDNFEGIDEIRPGNFIFYDLWQHHLGACSFNNIAVAMACPVVAKHSNRHELIVYGGAIHFSKEYIELKNQKIFGQVVKLTQDGWVQQNTKNYLTKLSQEHGTIKADSKLFREIQVGDLIGIIPIHSCLTANLSDRYIDTQNQTIEHL